MHRPSEVMQRGDYHRRHGLHHDLHHGGGGAMTTTVVRAGARLPRRNTHHHATLRSASARTIMGGEQRQSGGGQGQRQPKMTLLTEFRQIVQYTRRKRSKSLHSRKSLPPIASVREEHRDDEERDPPPHNMRRSSLSASSFHDRIKESTFSRNVDFLQERTKQLSERRLRRTSSENSTLLTKSASFNDLLELQAQADEYSAAAASAAVQTVHGGPLVVVSPDDSFSIDGSETSNSVISQRSSASTRSSSMIIVQSFHESFADSIFARNVDYLQAKSEELSRTLHGTVVMTGEELEQQRQQEEGEEEEAEGGGEEQEEVCRSIPRTNSEEDETATTTVVSVESTVVHQSVESADSSATAYVDYFQTAMSVTTAFETIKESMFEDGGGNTPDTSSHGGAIEDSTFSKNVDYLQEQAEELTRSVVETVAQSVPTFDEEETAEQEQEQQQIVLQDMSSTSRNLAESGIDKSLFSRNVDYLQAQTEEFSRSVAGSLGGWASYFSG